MGPVLFVLAKDNEMERDPHESESILPRRRSTD